MSDMLVSNRRQLLVGTGLAASPPARSDSRPSALAAGPPRKLIWVPQALGDWDTALQVGCKDFCDMAGWEYQRIGNPNYSVENHVEQVNNAIAAKADIILTQLESPGLLPAFERGLAEGVTMVIINQGRRGRSEEARARHHRPERVRRRHHQRLSGRRLRREAARQEGAASIVLGNGNPGAVAIDNRQAGAEEGVKQYNAEHGTNFTFEAYPDGEFGELTESIQKWTAQFGQKGPDLVAALATGNPTPIYQAMQELGMAPGSVVVGSHDIPPAHQKAITDGWVQWGIDQQMYYQGFFGAAVGLRRQGDPAPLSEHQHRRRAGDRREPQGDRRSLGALDSQGKGLRVHVIEGGSLPPSARPRLYRPGRACLC